MHYTPRLTIPTVVLAALIGAVHVLSATVGIAIDAVVSGNRPIPWWLDLFGATLGGAVSALLLSIAIVSVVLSPVLTFVFGYWIGQQLDLRREYRRVLCESFIGASVGIALGGTLVAAGFWFAFGTSVQFLDALIEATAPVAAEVVRFVIAVFAGAALAQFRQRSGGDSPAPEDGESALHQHGERA
jgi:hypothetical protein